MSSENDSDEFDEILTEDIIDEFYYNYIRKIQYLSEDIQYRFYYFLNKNNMYPELYNLILDLYLKKNKLILVHTPFYFIIENEQEIDTTLMVVNNFLSLYFKNIQINKTIWANYCFQNTF